jgi:hypothetical protein
MANEDAQNAIRRHIPDLITALTATRDTESSFSSIVLSFLQQKQFDEPSNINITREDALQVVDLVNSLLKAVYNVDDLGKFLATLTKKGGIPGREIANAIARDLDGHKLPQYHDGDTKSYTLADMPFIRRLFSPSDVAKLTEILQPIMLDELGQHLNMEEAILIELSKMKEFNAEEKTKKLKFLLQKWMERDGTLSNLVEALRNMNKKDLIPGLHEIMYTDRPERQFLKSQMSFEEPTFSFVNQDEYDIVCSGLCLSSNERQSIATAAKHRIPFQLLKVALQEQRKIYLEIEALNSKQQQLTTSQPQDEVGQVALLEKFKQLNQDYAKLTKQFSEAIQKVEELKLENENLVNLQSKLNEDIGNDSEIQDQVNDIPETERCLWKLDFPPDHQLLPQILTILGNKWVEENETKKCSKLKRISQNGFPAKVTLYIQVHDQIVACCIHGENEECYIKIATEISKAISEVLTERASSVQQKFHCTYLDCSADEKHLATPDKFCPENLVCDMKSKSFKCRDAKQCVLLRLYHQHLKGNSQASCLKYFQSYMLVNFNCIIIYMYM